MRRAVLGLLVIAVCVVGVPAASTQTSSALAFTRGPYSGAPTANSVVLSWVVDPSARATVEIAPAASPGVHVEPVRRIAAEAPVDDAHGQVDVAVEDLAPGTAYVYRVIVQTGTDIATSPVGRFRTQPPSGEAITFAVLSDTQWQWEGANRLRVIGDAVAFDSARSGGFDFVLHAGDLVETPNAFYWEPWFDSFESMLLAAPFIPVLGNHEKNSLSYYNAFSHPAGAGQNDERWWTLRWGDVVIVGLDTSANRPDRIQQQQDYARAELGGPERWKFVIFHHPIYSSDAYHGSGYGFEKIFHPIFVEAGVDMVFNGHAHNYERIEKDGIVYLILGGGGAVPRPLASTRVDGSVVAIENKNFYARVAVAGDDLAVDIVSVADATETTFGLTPGEILDSFTVKKLSIAAPLSSVAEIPAVESPASDRAPSETPPSSAFETGGPEAAAPQANVPSLVETVRLAAENVERIAPVVVGVGLAVLASVVAVIAAAAWIVWRILL